MLQNQILRKQLDNWLEAFIIGLNLCPFAKKPWSLGLLKIRIITATKEEELTQALLEELSALVGTRRDVLETTLLAFPHLLTDFDDFLAYQEWTEEILETAGLSGLIQIVGFHPDYYFEGTTKEDHGNFTNRSPCPLLHLIREESVDEAIRSYPNIEHIPKRNIALLKEMKLADLKKYVYAKNDIG